MRELVLGRKGKTAKQSTDPTALQAIANLEIVLDRSPTTLPDGRTLDKEGLKRDVRLVMQASSEYQSGDLVFLTAASIAHLSPDAYLAMSTQDAVRALASRTETFFKLRPLLEAVDRRDVVEALGRIQLAELSVRETCPAGQATLAMLPMVMRVATGQTVEGQECPPDGWYLVGDAGTVRWRYCDGASWTDHYSDVSTQQGQ